MSRDKPVRILLAAAAPLLRAGLRTVLSAEPDLDVVAEAADGEQAWGLARRLLPDVLLSDAALPRRDGIAVADQITTARLPVRVVLLTGPEPDAYVVSALRAGASGLLSHDTPAGELVAAIRTVAAGHAAVAPPILRQLLQRLVALAPQPPAAVAHRLDVLTDREREVLVHIARGESNDEIARALSVSQTTVKTHVGNVLTKLRLRDRVQAVVLAYESGLVRPGSG